MSLSTGPESPALSSQYMAYDSHQPQIKFSESCRLTVALFYQLIWTRFPLPPPQFLHETKLGPSHEPKQ
jgi:hypothetical protein